MAFMITQTKLKKERSIFSEKKVNTQNSFDSLRF